MGSLFDKLMEDAVAASSERQGTLQDLLEENSHPAQTHSSDTVAETNASMGTNQKATMNTAHQAASDESLTLREFLIW